MSNFKKKSKDIVGVNVAGIFPDYCTWSKWLQHSNPGIIVLIKETLNSFVNIFIKCRWNFCLARPRDLQELCSAIPLINSVSSRAFKIYYKYLIPIDKNPTKHIFLWFLIHSDIDWLDSRKCSYDPFRWARGEHRYENMRIRTTSTVIKITLLFKLRTR